MPSPLKVCFLFCTHTNQVTCNKAKLCLFIILHCRDHGLSSGESNESPFQLVVKDLKSLSLKEICSIFGHYQKYLRDVYNRLVKETVKF